MIKKGRKKFFKFLINYFFYFKNGFSCLLTKILYIRSTGFFPSIVKYVALMFLVLPKRKTKNIGALQARPSIRSIFYACNGMLLNSNHLGSVFTVSESELDLSHRMEKEVIDWTKKLFKVNNKNIEGYVTSGGTESNLFVMWSARDYLNKKQTSKCGVILSCLTHYSVSKAARMLNIKAIYTPLDMNSWSIDTVKIEKTINKMNKQGIKNIMLPVTLGYSSTGTCDSLGDIVQIVKTTCNKNNMKFIIWVDAAGQGLPIAYLSSNFKPFINKEIFAISIDFHKLGNSPLPSGMVLFKKELRDAIQRPIGYLSETDVTVSGSRPGFSSMAIWANVYTRTYNSWRKDYLKCERTKNIFVRQFCSYFPKKNIICTLHTLTCAIVVDKDFKRLPKLIEEKYCLYLGTISIDHQKKKLRHYKIHFMPQTKQKVFDDFMKDILINQKKMDKLK